VNRKSLLILGILTLAATAAAQPLALEGPSSGLVFDHAARALRPILGIPGASYLGAARATASAGFVAPGSRLALLLDGDTLTLHTAHGHERLPWSGALDAAAFSENAVAAAGAQLRLYYQEDGAWHALSLPSPAEKVRALAIDSSERGVVALTASAVWHLHGDTARQVAPIAASALALTGANLYVTDTARNEVLAIRNFATAPEIARLAGDFDAPVGIAAASRGRLVVVDRTSIATLNALTGERLERLELDFSPAGLEVLANDLFRLDGRSHDFEPVQLATLHPSLRVYFVPGKSGEE
jgi:hypothetical protein